jgi:acetyl-CoA synthetase
VSSDPTRAPEIEALLLEQRTFLLDADFAAWASSAAALYQEADADSEASWARQARERLNWFTPFGTTLEWNLPHAEWFVGGELVVDTIRERLGRAGD